jgi:hypothetical protein
MDLPIRKKENTSNMDSLEQMSIGPNTPFKPSMAQRFSEPSMPNKEEEFTSDFQIEPSVIDERNASEILDAEENELPPDSMMSLDSDLTPQPSMASLDSEITPSFKQRTKRCPKGCVNKSRCKGGIIKGGKKRKSRKSKRRKSRKSKKN